MAIRPPWKTTHIDELPPEDEGPSPDELVDFGGETTEAFVARTGAMEPQRLSAGDAVPVLRSDLKIERGSVAGLFQVEAPGAGRAFTLYEFELSIARMLDGRRHASDVIENGVRLGIPVDLEGLNKFVRQIWRYGFLAEPGTAAPEAEAEGGGWGEREKWDEATRTLFQTGLRLMRQGRPQDAQSYFHAVLDADPGNEEASELLAAIERGETLVASPLGRGPRRGSPSRTRRPLAIAVAVAACAGLLAAGGVILSSRPRRVPPRPAAGRPPPPAPEPVWQTATVESRGHPRVGALLAQAEGIVLWKRPDGAGVAIGERIGTLRRPRGGAREVPLLAPNGGILRREVPERARVAAGARLASVEDERTWIVEAFVDGETPAIDAACELRGDTTAERAPCKLDAARPRDGGSGVRLTVEATEVPWVGSARSLRVRIAPRGAPGERGR